MLRKFKKLLQLSWRKFSVLLLLFIATTLLVLDILGLLSFKGWQQFTTDTVTKNLFSVSFYITKEKNNALAFLKEQANIIEENNKLRKENQRLLHLGEKVAILEAEKKRLSALAKANFVHKTDYITTHIIATPQKSFRKVAVLNAGKKDGVAIGQAVVNAQGLIGHIIKTTQHTSQVLLLLDGQSRIPVVIGVHKWRAIMAGENDIRPRLLFVTSAANLTTGEIVSTSGHGGTIPPGLPIGSVQKISNSLAYVQSFVDFNALNYVRVLRYKIFPVKNDATKNDAIKNNAATKNVIKKNAVP